MKLYRLLTLPAILLSLTLLPRHAFAQNNQILSAGGIGVSCNAVSTATSANPGTALGCVSFAWVGSAPSIYSWQVLTTGSPTGLIVNFMGSLDGVTWTQIDTTGVVGTRTVTNMAYRFVGCVPATLSGGSSPTVTCQISASGNSGSVSSIFAPINTGIDIQSKGALGNGQVVRDAVTNGTTTVTSASALFAAGDVGKSVICVGCSAGVNLVTTVAGFTSSSSITLGGSPALTLPINIICVGCTTVPYGYATVNSAGAITGGTIVANGTSGAASCTVKILMQQSQSGSGGGLTCAVGGGVVSSLTVGTAGSGYFATLYWATDDSTAIASAMTAASAIQGCVYVPQAQKSFYMMNTQLTWGSNTCIFGAGEFTRSYILGDPCTASCTTFLASSLILRNGTANQEMWGLHLDNVHAISASATDAFSGVVDCEHCGQGFDHNIQVTSCRGCFRSASSSSATASNMRHQFLYCTGFVDYCVFYQGATGQNNLNTNIQVSDSHFLAKICTLLGPNPCNDVFFEDTGSLIVNNNYASDPADSSQVSEGFFGASVNHAVFTGGSQFINVHDNQSIELSPGITTTLNCATFINPTTTNTFSNVVYHHNICNGAATGFSMINQPSVALATLGNVKVDDNQFQSCGWSSNGCIAIGTSGSCCVGLNGNINGNTIFGPPTGTSGTGPCINLTLTGNTEIVGNNITWCGTYGVLFNGVQTSVIASNTIFNVGQATTNTYDGVFLQSSGANKSFSNTIANNTIYDNQGGSQTQRYGINLAAQQAPSNKISGNVFAMGNKTANINDATVGVGQNLCTWYEGTIGCDDESVTINSLGVTTLVSGTFPSNQATLVFQVTIAWSCTAVAGSTLQWQVNYFSPMQSAGVSQTGASHACTSAAEGSDTFYFRHSSGGANVISYQAIVASVPAFRDKATVQLQ